MNGARPGMVDILGLPNADIISAKALAAESNIPGVLATGVPNSAEPGAFTRCLYSACKSLKALSAAALSAEPRGNL